MPRPQFTLKTLLWLMAVVAVVAAIANAFRPGIRVIVKNTGSTPVRAITLHVTGNAHHVGDLAPAAQEMVIVKPISESHLEIEFAEGGSTRRIVVPSYFEPGYRGTISLSIKDGSLAEVKGKTNIY